ncbi:MAG: NADH:ubiquinone oxidoreductase subunit J [Cyclobacteriaceae bacterium]|nr:MAG: NADH:ubiquinone oxidoreductase subunit J [Cyclobacteriaceae bacterium]
MIALFYIAAFVAVISTLMAITRFNAVHALIYLVVSLLSVAVIFYLLGAPFAAALEVIIYAGAIMVLLIFMVMMLHLGETSIQQEKQWLNWSVWLGPGFLSLILLVEMSYLLVVSNEPGEGLTVVDATQVGIALYGPYIITVELAAILLLAGIVGAYYLGQEKRRVLHRFLNQEDND